MNNQEAWGVRSSDPASNSELQSTIPSQAVDLVDQVDQVDLVD